MCDRYAQSNHRSGTKAHDGRCSWRENCDAAVEHSVTVTYLATGRRYSYALCELDHSRVHEYFALSH